MYVSEIPQLASCQVLHKFGITDQEDVCTCSQAGIEPCPLILLITWTSKNNHTFDTLTTQPHNIRFLFVKRFNHIFQRWLFNSDYTTIYVVDTGIYLALQQSLILECIHSLNNWLQIKYYISIIPHHISIIPHHINVLRYHLISSQLYLFANPELQSLTWQPYEVTILIYVGHMT